MASVKERLTDVETTLNLLIKGLHIEVSGREGQKGMTKEEVKTTARCFSRGYGVAVYRVSDGVRVGGWHSEADELASLVDDSTLRPGPEMPSLDGAPW